MTILVDDTLATAQITLPLAQGWTDAPVPVETRANLRAKDVGPADAVLLPAPEATLLAGTHQIVPEVAVVFEGTGPIAMRTPIRPDGVDETVVRLLHAGPTAEVVMRALLRPYFGITATRFAESDDDPHAAEAQVVVVDGALGLQEPEAGFQDDLARAWFVLTGQALVSHVAVIGRDVPEADVEPAIDALRRAAALGVERRREVRGIMAERWNIEERTLSRLTNRTRFALSPEDRLSLGNLLARGTWGSRFGRALPPFRDTTPS